LLTDERVPQALDEYGDDSFVAKMGAEAVREALKGMDHGRDRRRAAGTDACDAARSRPTKKLSKRLKVVEGFIQSKSRPEWMVLEVLPVIPPDLRPLVPLDGGRFATSDLQRPLPPCHQPEQPSPEPACSSRRQDVIIHNEKRMLQEAVDALFDNGRRGRPVTGCRATAR
jgi:DNA-directed RNA polymerase subunit beta'